MAWHPIANRAADPVVTGKPGRAEQSSGRRQSFGADGEPALIADVDGRIIQCSDAATATLMRSREALLGRGLDELIPGLPVSARTPGYNVAYARMQAGSWQRHQAVAVDGRRIDVELMLDVLPLRSRFLIVVRLNPPGFGLHGHA